MADSYASEGEAFCLVPEGEIRIAWQEKRKRRQQ